VDRRHETDENSQCGDAKRAFAKDEAVVPENGGTELHKFLQLEVGCQFLLLTASFDYQLESGKKLDTETVIATLKVVLPGKPHVDDFCAFLEVRLPLFCGDSGRRRACRV
jgi:hypothetical protein